VAYRLALVVGAGLDGMLNSAANAARTYQGRAYDRDGDPGTGPDGKEYVVHWLRTIDAPTAAVRGTLAAQVVGTAARVDLTAHATDAGSLALERRAHDGLALRRWAESEFGSLVRDGDDLRATVIDDEPVGWPRTYRLLLVQGGQESLLDRTEVSGLLPSALRIDASPNPFNPRLEIRLALPRSGPVEVGVYDLRGRRLQTLLSGQQAAGEKTLVWDGRDGTSRAAPAGIYLVRARDRNGQALARVALVR
jgi:hypothetical protein